MLDTFEYPPEDHPGYETVIEILTARCEALLNRQDRSGFWHYILEYPDSPLEMSGTLQFVYTFDRETRWASSTRISAGVGASHGHRGGTVEGQVRRVAVPLGGPNAPLDWTAYGQQWFLPAANRLL